MTTKDRVLTLLEQNRGSAVSGEKLAQRLAVSRAAIWKAVKELQRTGHSILAVTNKGYTLLESSDVLSVEGIRALLARPEVTVAAYDTVDSTNTVAKQLAAQGAPHGSLVVASCQTAGRGRRGRSFLSPAGTGLYLSVILRCPAHVPMVNAALLTSAAAVAVCRALHTICGEDSVGIKWVNDIYKNGKKCCGILTEAAADMESGCVDYIIVGIGLNLRIPAGGFPPELAEIATALFNAVEPVPRCALTADIVNELLALCDALPDAAFMDEYRARSLVPGRDIVVVQNGENRPAHALSITDDGHLRVCFADGTEDELSFGEVSVRL